MVVPGGLKSKKKLYEGDVVVEHGVIVQGGERTCSRNDGLPVDVAAA